jgi:hypothetical protein
MAALTNQQHDPTPYSPSPGTGQRALTTATPPRPLTVGATLAAVLAFLGLTLVGLALVGAAPAGAAQVPVMGADTARRLPGPPSGYTVPVDGRLRGDGFTATITGVATGPGTATLRARPGQRLWAWGVTVTRGHPASGGAPVTVSVTVTAGSDMTPVPLPSTTTGSGVSWFLVSVPATAPDVTVTLSADESSAVFSLSKMVREDPQPTASYRDPTSWETTVTDPQTVTLPASFVDDQGFSFPVDPEPIMFTSATLSYWAPDQPGHTATTTDQAWLVVHLSSGGNDPNVAFADDATLPATDLALTVPGQAPVPATDFPGPTIPPDSSAAITPDIFGGDTYAFQVPATITTATLAVTPGSYPADATDTGIATFPLTLPAPVTPTPPPGASTRPGRLTALPAGTTPNTSRAGSGTKKTASPPLTQPNGTSHTGLIAALIAVVVVLAAGSVLVARRRRTPTLAATGAPPGATAFRSPTPTPAPAPADPVSPPAPAEKTDPSPTGGPPEPDHRRVDDHDADDHTTADRGADDQSADDQSADDQSADVPASVTPASVTPASVTPATVDPATVDVAGERQGPVIPVIPARPVLVLPDPVTPAVPVPSVRVLGHVRVDGFVDLPAQGPLVDLLIFLALHPGRAFLNDTLRGRLAEGDEAEVSEQTMQSYVSRLRRHLPAGADLVYSRSGYRLAGVTTDLTVFDDLAATTPAPATTPGGAHGADGDADLEAIASVSAALALVEGEPFETGHAPRWVTDENFRSDIQKKTAAAARRLDTLTSPFGAYDRALWGYHQAIIADPDDQALAADALTTAHRHLRPGTLVHEWDQTLERLAAAGQKPSADLGAHYQRLRQHSPA